MSQLESPDLASPDVGTADARQGRHLTVALLIIATAQLVVVLDSTIVNVALPHIQRRSGFPATAWSGW